MKDYTISIFERKAILKIFRENYASEAEYKEALDEAEGQIFLDVQLSCETKVRGINTAIIEKDKWRLALQQAMEISRLCILSHEGDKIKNVLADVEIE